MPTIKEFIERVYDYAGLELTEDGVEIAESDEVVEINVTLVEADSGIGIGSKGEAQYALQRMARIIFGEEFQDKKIVLNVNQYLDQRKEKLVELAHQVAQEAIETGEEQVIHTHLPAHERYIIHTTISEDEELAEKVHSHSEGRGRDRKIVISPTE